MLLQEAINLIEFPKLSTQGPGIWADLGCGQGTFTIALANLLQAGSTIHAVDQNKKMLGLIPDTVKGISIIKHHDNFEKMTLPPAQFNGILMANALHYVKNKLPLIERLKASIVPDGYLLIIEYDSSIANPWVPFPINFKKLGELARKMGLNAVKLKEMPSRFRSSNIYSALIS